MRHLLLLALFAAVTACTVPPPKEASPEPLPAHPSGTVTTNDLPAPSRAN